MRWLFINHRQRSVDKSYPLVCSSVQPSFAEFEHAMAQLRMELYSQKPTYQIRHAAKILNFPAQL